MTRPGASRAIAIAIAAAGIAAIPHAAAGQPAQTPPPPSAAGPVFLVEIDPALDLPPRSGRIVVYLIEPDADISPRTPPAMAPFFQDPQPVYGVDVDNIRPGTQVRLDDSTAIGYPGPLRDLPAGEYRAQAVFDWQSESGSWSREPGNLFSGVARITIKHGAPVVVPIKLTNTVPAPPEPSVAGGQFFEIRSALLSEFRGREVMLRAGVALPIDHDPLREYPAIYSIPGFGGDRTDALREAQQRRQLTPGTDEHTLASSAFYIVIDPDGPNGHTLMADSDNNGPVGRAITEELIPALERRYRLLQRPEARLVTGHSSGGWTTLWLATEYPHIFGAGWSSAPDPVDFHAFQKIDIYNDQSMYDTIAEDGARTPIPSFTKDGVVLMTIAQENAVENAIGPRNTSGEQWDSWLAVFGPRAEDGHPADLYDTTTGAIDRDIAQRYRRYDITHRLRQDPQRFAPIFRDRIRLVIGDADSFDLHIAVARLQQALGEVAPRVTAEITHGSIEIVPGADHGSVLRSDAIARWPADMLAHLRRSNIPLRAGAPPEPAAPAEPEPGQPHQDP